MEEENAVFFKVFLKIHHFVKFKKVTRILHGTDLV